MTKLLALLKSAKTRMGLGTFVLALASQPAVQALAGGHVPLTRDLVVSAVLGALGAVLHPYLPKD